MAITDLDEWLHPGTTHDEVVLDVGGVTNGGLVLQARLAITPADRRVHLVATVDGAVARHDAAEPGPPSANWDRMRIGSVEWRMVEPLRRWELSVDDPDADLRAYLAFVGSSPCEPVTDGYQQAGTVSGQLQLADLRVAVADAPARRTHTWR